jgi:hypothetical protein
MKTKSKKVTRAAEFDVLAAEFRMAEALTLEGKPDTAPDTATYKEATERFAWWVATGEILFEGEM